MDSFHWQYRDADPADVDLEEEGLYVLDANNWPCVPRSLKHWMAMMDNEKRRIVGVKHFGNYQVDTFFTGVNRFQFTRDHEIALFETRVWIKSPNSLAFISGYYWPTWEAAELGHRKVSAFHMRTWRKAIRADKSREPGV